MASILTHYDNLKVARNAPVSIIKAAYKALCQTYHPDKFQGSNEEAERITKLINTSYEVLIDPIKRAKHDRWINEQEAKAKQKSKKAQFKKTSKATEQQHYQKQKHTQPPPKSKQQDWNQDSAQEAKYDALIREQEVQIKQPNEKGQPRETGKAPEKQQYYQKQYQQNWKPRSRGHIDASRGRYTLIQYTIAFLIGGLFLGALIFYLMY